jgi:hypothetical protein
MKIGTLLTLVASTCAVCAPLVHATEVTGLNTFTAGTPAKAAEVNSNFSAVKTAVDDNHARITTLETGTGGAQGTLTDHENRITVLETGDELGPLMYGDGSAGDLVISGNVLWGAAAPTNLNFNNVTIQSGGSLTVAGGTTIRCAGAFVNNGAIVVAGFTSGGLVSTPNAGVIGTATAYPHPGDTPNGPSLAAYDSDGFFSDIERGLGGSAMLHTAVVSSLSSLHFGGSGGGGTAGKSGGFGGGVLRILSNNGISSTGTISADGTTGAGGGGGGFVVLASRTSVNNAGTINARGGAGASSTTVTGASGGGGGGFVVLIAPSVASSGAIDVSGGIAGTASTAVTNLSWRSAGGGGGGSGGIGGHGGSVSGTVSQPGEPGDPGQILTLQQDPLFVVR